MGRNQRAARISQLRSHCRLVSPEARDTEILSETIFARRDGGRKRRNNAIPIRLQTNLARLNREIPRLTGQITVASRYLFLFLFPFFFSSEISPIPSSKWFYSSSYLSRLDTPRRLVISARNAERDRFVFAGRNGLWRTCFETMINRSVSGSRRGSSTPHCWHF